MSKDVEPFDINIDTLGFHVNRVFYTLVKRLTKGLKEKGLKIQFSEFTILKVLSVLKGASQTQLATQLGKERAALVRPLSCLENEGYILRVPKDGKTNYVTLTEKGENVLPVIDEIIENVTQQAFKGFSKKSRTSTINNLTRIYLNSLYD